MNPTKLLAGILLLFITTSVVQAQQLQSTLVAGPHKTNFQTFWIQPLDAAGNFTMTNLAFFQRYHEAEDQPFDELGVQGVVFWNFSKNLSVGPGLYYNDPKGFMPKGVLQTFHQWGAFRLITNPAIYYHEDGFWGGELFVQATVTKAVNSSISLFAQLNGLTTWDQFEDHGRSFIQLRVGPRFKKGLHLGLAYDRDWYSPRKLTQQSLGFFVEQRF